MSEKQETIIKTEIKQECNDLEDNVAPKIIVEQTFFIDNKNYIKKEVEPMTEQIVVEEVPEIQGATELICEKRFIENRTEDVHYRDQNIQQSSFDECKKRRMNTKDTLDRKKQEMIRSASPPTKKSRTWALEDELVVVQTTYEGQGTSSNGVEEEIVQPYSNQSLPVQPILLEYLHASGSQFTPEPEHLSPDDQDFVITSSTSSTPRLTETSFTYKQEKVIETDNADEQKAVFKQLLPKEKDDYIDLFLQSIGWWIKKMPEENQWRLQVKITELVNAEKEKIKKEASDNG